MIHRSGIISGKRVYQTPLDRPDLLDNATDLEYQISSHQVWRPGIYDSERAARYACQFYDEDLGALQEQVNAQHPDPADRVITFEMLRGLRRRVGRTKPWERTFRVEDFRLPDDVDDGAAIQRAIDAADGARRR